MTTTRREFVAQLGAAALVGGSLARPTPALDPHAVPGSPAPWYRRTLRWGQTNITEIDPERYDIAWWRQYWTRTAIQGVIVNAGGIVAYYPSRYPLQYRAARLGDRDLFGDLARAAREQGLTVVARMDSNRVHEPVFREHPDWIAVDADGAPYRSGDLYVTCINGPYYRSFLPDVMREIIERARPDGFTDNSWSGLDRNSVCYCENCQRGFRDTTGRELPRRRDWEDVGFRRWIEWSYARRLQLWDENNAVTRAAGGADCIWVGMNGGGIAGQARSFRDYRAICARTPIVLLDHQTRSNAEGFQHNAFTGKLIHGMLGWDKLIPESMPMYQIGTPMFRLATKPPAEARAWMLAGFAGGIQPWWHHVSAYHEDRRMYRTAEPMMHWHRENERYLVDRTPVASVGLVWSQRSVDFYGRDAGEELTELPLRGWMHALVRARIPHVPIHVDQIGEIGAGISVLVLPNLGALADAQVAAIRRFVERGGALIATGQTSLFDEWGDARSDFALADLFGASRAESTTPARTASERLRSTAAAQTYLRLTPELRAGVDGPHVVSEPRATGTRHPVLAGFAQTDILAYGGSLEPLRVAAGASVLATFIPAFPAFPPETAWMREPRTEIPGLVVNEQGGRRVAFMPADLDRRYAIDNLPDHGDLLANLVRWAAGDSIPLRVEGPGLLDVELYRQSDRLVLHVVNLTGAGSWRAPMEEIIPVGPVDVRLRDPARKPSRMVRWRVGGRTERAVAHDGWLRFTLPVVREHELALIE
ncbi:MAG: Tat pathway signal protein [Gemmatimonadetes bacterium]|nr:MAG: Tat pathway signal protein [Gemmatimonadota bacterium]